MQNNLLSIFKAITPDNIKNIPLIEDSSRIFIELLNEHCYISADIKSALSEQTTDSIAEELHKIYLYDYYSMIENLKTNKVINQKFKNWNSILKPNLYPTGLPYIGDKLFINYFTIGKPGGVLSSDAGDNFDINYFPFSDKLNLLQGNILQNKAENYYVNRLFKQSKGLKKSIQFIYDILNEYLVNINERVELNFQESDNPFELQISGSIDKDVYRESVAYLAHPLGFVYDYTYISELKLQDNYSLLKFYKINQLEVRCLSGNVESYTKEVQNIIEKEDYLKIIFKDGFYLLQENDVVKYFNNLDMLIKVYPNSNHCSIYVDYEIIYKSTLEDYVNYLNELELQSINTNVILDDVSSVETERFKNNMLISDTVGTIIGSEVISNDSDQFETVKIKETTLYDADYKLTFDNYDTSLIVDTLDTLNTNVNNSEQFNVANISEDFTIELI